MGNVYIEVHIPNVFKKNDGWSGSIGPTFFVSGVGGSE